MDPETLEGLARGSGARVRVLVAANPSLPQSLADQLLADRNRYVRGVAAAHPGASAAGLRELAAGLSEPVWTLRAIAANPACPPDLCDELLTWIALGGSDHADPLFDPVECTGHPGDTRIDLQAWCLQQARGGAGFHHPLWRVRAAVVSSLGRISFVKARDLAGDPRPEVRRTVAGLSGPADMLRMLKGDADPAVARLAASVYPRAAKRNRRVLLARIVWVSISLVLMAGIVIAGH